MNKDLLILANKRLQDVNLNKEFQRSKIIKDSNKLMNEIAMYLTLAKDFVTFQYFFDDDTSIKPQIQANWIDVEALHIGWVWKRFYDNLYEKNYQEYKSKVTREIFRFDVVPNLLSHEFECALKVEKDNKIYYYFINNPESETSFLIEIDLKNNLSEMAL